MVNKPGVPPKGKQKLAPMPTTPGDYLSGGSTRDSYAKSMTPEARKKDAAGGGITTPRTFMQKGAARKTGGFKGFKI